MLNLCPFPYKRYNPETGLLHKQVNGDADGYNSKHFCNYGKGSWCGQCQHYNQWKVSNAQWLRKFNGIAQKKKAPWLWSKPNPQRIVNPL